MEMDASPIGKCIVRDVFNLDFFLLACRSQGNHARPHLKCRNLHRPQVKRGPPFLHIVMLVIHGHQSAQAVIQATLGNNGFHPQG